MQGTSDPAVCHNFAKSFPKAYVLSIFPNHFGVLTVDGIDLDLILLVPELPGEDHKVIGKMISHTPGGPAANFACAASRLGMSVASLAEVGSDQAGQIIVNDFNDYGVDTTFIQVRPDSQTCFTVILVPPSGEKAIVVVPTFTPMYSVELLTTAVSNASLIYMMPQDHEHFFRIADIARLCGTPVMIDVEPSVALNRNVLDRMLSVTNIISFNKFGFEAACGVAPTLSTARALLSYGPEIVVVTLGAQGALAVSKTEASIVPGYRVSVMDTTGAGDTFNAAFTVAQNMPLSQRLQFANATAALSTTGLGPRGNLPTADQVQMFLANAQLN